VPALVPAPILKLRLVLVPLVLRPLVRMEQGEWRLAAAWQRPATAKLRPF
jgi:hypothetical protein